MSMLRKKKMVPNFILPKINAIKFRQKNFKIFFGKKKSSIFFKIVNIFFNYYCLKNYFRKNVSKKNDNLFYLDGYSFYFLFSLIFFLFTIKSDSNNKIILWIRYPFNSFLKKNIFKFFLLIVNLKFKKKFFLTENTLLQKVLKKNFKLNKINLMPSLHNLFESQKKYSIKTKINNRKNFVLSCPGGYRFEKYGKNLINFIKQNQNTKFKLIISKKFKKYLPKNKKFKFNNIIFRKDNLSIKNHIREIINCDAVILPYQMPDYSFRTSGIFFETISLNKPAFITDGTLLSKDLKKFNLNFLIIKDWNFLEIAGMQNQIKLRKNVLNLSKFANHYRKINGFKSFLNKFYKII